MNDSERVTETLQELHLWDTAEQQTALHVQKIMRGSTDAFSRSAD
jgi:hypothetical protein